MSTSIAALRITGTRSFSEDFQTILNRAVSIASIPLQAIQNDQAELISKKQLLAELRASVAGLGAAVSALGSLGESRGISATSSNVNRVSVSISGNAGVGVHTITDIRSVARAAAATSVLGYANSTSEAASSDGILELVVGSKSYSIDLAAGGQNSLGGLRDAINQLGAGVTAAILNTGSGETPFYLALTATAAGEKAFELREIAGRADTNLLTNERPAENAVYTANTGLPDTDSAAVSSDGLLELAAGGSTYSIDLAGANHLAGLCDAINGLGAGLAAETVDEGAAAGDSRYRLKITSADGETVELRETAGEAATNLLTNAHQGANAVFKFDGLDVVKPDNVVNDVLSGLTFIIQSTTSPGEQVFLSLSSSRGELASALGSLVSSYNEVGGNVKAQIGEGAGLLSGDPAIREIQQSLRALASYSAGGTIRSLADLGIRMDDQGVMSFDSSVFYSLSNSDIAAAFDFLGSATSGLGAVTQRFTGISDPATGFIRLQQDQCDVADARMSRQAEALIERINLMQATLVQQLAQADSLLAMLESQQNMLDASIRSLNLALFGKRDE